MIVNENITKYIHSLAVSGPDYLEKIRSCAEKNEVPVIRREMEPFIKVLFRMNKPRKILEIGTAVGYSALFFESLAPEAEIITIENYEPRLKEARKNFEGHKNITLLEGDAVKLIKNIEGGFDFVFLDAAKGQYIQMLPDISGLLKVGGMLLADNCLQDGDIVKSRFAAERRQRTIHERMREFIWQVCHDECFETSLVPIGDGVTLSIKIQDGKNDR